MNITEMLADRELRSLGGQLARKKERGVPEAEIADLQRRIVIARAERTIRNALSTVPLAERQRILWGTRSLPGL